MSQSLADVIIHLVFSTKDRLPLIKPEIEDELYKYICGISHNFDSPIIIINGVEDHLHIILQLGRTISLSKLISEIKSSSSRWIKSKDEQYSTFAWQGGYGAFSVSRPSLESVKRYVASQKEHHKTITFKDELLAMLKRAEVSHEPKYLWD